MNSETEITEFLSLLKETREQLEYFKELGVERIEHASSLGWSGETTNNEREQPATESLLHPVARTSATVAAVAAV